MNAENDWGKREEQMADWMTVRFDPNYEEKLDPEIVPLCDALNDAGFITTSSCIGHGNSWPHVWFEHSTDERIERLARLVKETETGDFRPYFSMWQKEVLSEGYAWSVEIHLNNVYSDTPRSIAQAAEIAAVNRIAQVVRVYRVSEG
jgi:hypothetical protein